MRDNKLSLDGIAEKYENKIFVINSLRNIGTFFGGGYALLGIGSNCVEEVLIESGFGVFSYGIGSYFLNRTEKRKQLALKNIEKRVFEEYKDE
jgi:hypothetical protein